MNANINTVLQEQYQVVSFPAKPVSVVSPLIRVDMQELNRVTYSLLRAEESEISSTVKPKMSGKVDGKLTVKTLAAFISTGMKGSVIGLNAALKIQGYAARLDALQLLEAYYYIFRSRKAGSIEAVTPCMLQTQRDMIQQFKDQYTPSQVWIDSYLAKQEAAFEGKAARMAKKNEFNKAMAAAK